VTIPTSITKAQVRAALQALGLDSIERPCGLTIGNDWVHFHYLLQHDPDVDATARIPVDPDPWPWTR
jgi:hypothetical protein